MQPDIKWLDDPQTVRVGQLQAHSDHRIYRNTEEMKRRESSLVQSLNGLWQFIWSANPKSRPVDFYKEDYPAENFGKIRVPCHMEMAGYDKIHYTDTMYPWEGKVYRRPAYALGEDQTETGSFSQADYNPVGSYRTVFDLDEGLRDKRVCICFEGVEQAMYVWLNGKFIGYAEDSFTPSEFDLTPYIRKKDNLLAVEVYKNSTAAYLEDQDFFRFSGIYRNVSLYAKPKLHLEDLWVKPSLSEDLREGSLEVLLRISAEEIAENKTREEKMAGEENPSTRTKEGGGVSGKITLTLQDEEGCLIAKQTMGAMSEAKVVFESLEQVKLWDHKNPYLYQLTVTLEDGQGEVVEAVPCAVGFRRLELRDKVIYLNGRRLILNGVNRHEWSAQGGRCITFQDMEWDIECLKRNNINAVRTCHYPDQIPWYELCDRNGIYMMAETNLESHGSWQKGGDIEPSWNVPGSLPQWKEAVVDRARTNFETFKNHPSILFWSLGNESFVGDNIEAMQRFFKRKDPSRLVHYEGVVCNRAYEDTVSEVESRMYAKPADIVEYLEHDPKKPFILCEYMHDMGNSLGGMDSYIDLLDRFEMYQGGFIWDYIDQGILVQDEVTGKYVVRYGGDFDDRPSNYEFSGNGIVFADRTEKPAMQEVRYYYGLHE